MPAFSVAANGDLAFFARGINVVSPPVAIKRDVTKYRLGAEKGSSL
jgi:hypothetical protein